MPQKKYESLADFLDKWTDFIDSNGNKISDWCCKDRTNHTAYCIFCKVSFKVTETSGSRRSRILEHAKSLRHRALSEIKVDSENSLGNNVENDVKFNIKSCCTTEVKPSSIKSPMSKYEMMLEEKRAKNREFLESLGIGEVKSDLGKIINRMKVKRVKSERDPIIERKSKRLKEHVDYAEEIDWSVAGLRQKFCTTDTSFKKALKFNTSSQYIHFVKDFSEIFEANDNLIENPVIYNKDILRQLSPKASSMRIYKPRAMSWFPSTECLILAVGDLNGNLNLSNLKLSESKEPYLDFHVFSVHSKEISNVQFDPYNPFHLISSGIDGKVLCCDMQAQKFTEVLNTSERGCTYFDFFAPSSYIVSLTNGQVMILDSRERNREKMRSCVVPIVRECRQTVHNLHPYSILTVDVHPVNKNYFVTTARGENKICIWDLRNLRSSVIVDTSHKKEVVSATFSPGSGEFLLSKSMDEIGIFSCTSMTRRRMHCHKIMKHMDDSRKSRCTRPVWLPESDDIFAACIKNSPVQMFDKDLNIYETLSNGSVSFSTCQKKIIAFHPYKAALALASTNVVSVYL